MRGIEEEPRSPLAVAIGRIIRDAGRRSKPSFPLGAALRRATVWCVCGSHAMA